MLDQLEGSATHFVAYNFQRLLFFRGKRLIPKCDLLLRTLAGQNLGFYHDFHARLVRYKLYKGQSGDKSDRLRSHALQEFIKGELLYQKLKGQLAGLVEHYNACLFFHRQESPKLQQLEQLLEKGNEAIEEIYAAQRRNADNMRLNNFFLVFHLFITLDLPCIDYCYKRYELIKLNLAG